jgi:hypothetical protein
MKYKNGEYMQVSLEVIYTILIKWSSERQTRTYSELSNDYHTITGVFIEPYGSWDLPLGELANLLCAVGAPAITSLVVLKGRSQPVSDFFGGATNVVAKPKEEMGRITEWIGIINECFSHNWSPTIPVAPKLQDV